MRSTGKAFLKIWHLPYDLNNEYTKICICGKSFLVEELTDAKVLKIVCLVCLRNRRKVLQLML